MMMMMMMTMMMMMMNEVPLAWHKVRRLQGHRQIRLQTTKYERCYEIQYTWTARSTETETGLDRYVMLGARWLTEY